MLINKFVSVIVVLTFLRGSYGCINPDVVDLILLNFYTSDNQVQIYNVHNFHQILNHPGFLRERATVIYHYGFSQTLQTPSVAEVIHAYLTFGNVNTIFVNYESVATNISLNICTIGESLASAIIRFFNGGFQPLRLHLVGFSLGSSILGITGREVISQSNHTYMIERITGLEPGQIQESIRLNPNDARFVESVHTEAVGFGDHQTRGHVQYFVNGGVIQPMCNSLIPIIAQTCSHLFASAIWVESIRAQTAIFPALQCLSWEHFLRNQCNVGAPIGNLGVITSSALRDSYFLRTNIESPFSRSVAGP